MSTNLSYSALEVFEAGEFCEEEIIYKDNVVKVSKGHESAEGLPCMEVVLSTGHHPPIDLTAMIPYDHEIMKEFRDAAAGVTTAGFGVGELVSRVHTTAAELVLRHMISDNASEFMDVLRDAAAGGYRDGIIEGKRRLAEEMRKLLGVAP